MSMRLDSLREPAGFSVIRSSSLVSSRDSHRFRRTIDQFGCSGNQSKYNPHIRYGEGIEGEDQNRKNNQGKHTAHPPKFFFGILTEPKSQSATNNSNDER